MQIVVAKDGQQREVVVDVASPDALVGHLLAAMGMPAVDGIDVDGRFIPADQGIEDAPIPDGAIVTASAAHGPAWTPAADHQVALSVVAGAGTGMRVPLRLNSTIVLGRDSECDVALPSATVSGRHALVVVDGDGRMTVEDAESRNGTWIDGQAIGHPTPVEVGHTFRVGAVVVRVDGPDPDDVPVGVRRHFAPGNIPFNRPPRPARPRPVAPVTVPAKPEPSRASQGFRIAAMMGPLLMGGGMIWRTGDIRYALFALLSPVIFLVNFFSGRRRARKENDQNTVVFGQALADFRADLDRAWRLQRRRSEVVAPDMCEVLRRIEGPSVRLWEARLHHEDALTVRVGSAAVHWDPPLHHDEEQPREPELLTVVADYSQLPAAPVTVDLTDGGVVGIVGDRTAGLALARALLLQAATLHGPVDVQVSVLTTADGEADWSWAKWLPHTRDASGRIRNVSADHATSQQLTGGILDAWEKLHDRKSSVVPGFGQARGPSGPVRLLVVDDLALLAGRQAPTRTLLSGGAGPVAGIVLAATADQLPAACNVVVDVHSELGEATVHWPATATRVPDTIVAGLTVRRSRDAARIMARYDDPELVVAGGSVPRMVRLLPLLGMEDIDHHQLLTAWKEGMPDPGAAGPIGAGENGAIHLDLRTDGPHGLVGGTTGSGKSELLRSMVAGMAARVDPDHLVFVLVDYKGGSAFDECAKLPHTVGMVTDLDEHLGERALVSLEAELHHREHTLREAGAQDLPDYLKLGSPLGPMPRLVVVIDEFATMATELPDFLGALVGIAQRGRSLGVHMILATQRPRGAVNANIKANTNLRIALRVQDAGDSTDIIDGPEAAELSRDIPGRAYIRRGHGDLVMVQSALSTAPAPSGGADAIRLGTFRFAPTSPVPKPATGNVGPSDLARLVAACRSAFVASGLAQPRKPWLPMPSEHLTLDEVFAHPDAPNVPVPFALVDDPEAQAQRPLGWSFEEGHIAVFGMVGQGTTTTLLSLGQAIARTMGPDRCHIHGLDFGGGGITALEALPHTGSIIPANDTERQARLVRHLRETVDTRREMSADQRAQAPWIVVFVDGVAGFLAEHDGLESREIADGFKRVFNEGAAVKILFAVTGERPAALPTRLGSLVTQRVLLRLAEPRDFSLVGIREKGLPSFVPGRAIDGASKRVMQVGLPGDFAQLAKALPAGTTTPPGAIESLPTSVAFTRLVPAHPGSPIVLPVALSDVTMAPANLIIHPGDHVLIAGPPRSGKSSLMQLISAQLRAAVPDAIQLAICEPSRSPLSAWPSLDGSGTADDMADFLAAAPDHDKTWFVLVDDAGNLSGDTRFERLLNARPNLHVVAAGRTSDMKGGYGSWLRNLRNSRTGALLQPDLTADGDILSLRLPRRLQTSLPPGRGFLVNAGEFELAHFGLPPKDPPAGTIRL